jgi:hypothetical protein
MKPKYKIGDRVVGKGVWCFLNATLITHIYEDYYYFDLPEGHAYSKGQLIVLVDKNTRLITPLEQAML